MRRARAGSANSTEQYLITRSTPARTPPPLTGPGPEDEQLGALAAGSSEDSLDDLDQDPEDTVEDEVLESPGASVVGYGLYDAGAEALKW
jgi:hypothetical protein